MGRPVIRGSGRKMGPLLDQLASAAQLLPSRTPLTGPKLANNGECSGRVTVCRGYLFCFCTLKGPPSAALNGFVRPVFLPRVTVMDHMWVVRSVEGRVSLTGCPRAPHPTITTWLHPLLVLAQTLPHSNTHSFRFFESCQTSLGTYCVRPGC